MAATTQDTSRYPATRCGCECTSCNVGAIAHVWCRAGVAAVPGAAGAARSTGATWHACRTVVTCVCVCLSKAPRALGCQCRCCRYDLPSKRGTRDGARARHSARASAFCRPRPSFRTSSENGSPCTKRAQQFYHCTRATLTSVAWLVIACVCVCVCEQTGVRVAQRAVLPAPQATAARGGHHGAGACRVVGAHRCRRVAAGAAVAAVPYSGPDPCALTSLLFPEHRVRIVH
jgi:hypothetical protein